MRKLLVLEVGLVLKTKHSVEVKVDAAGLTQGNRHGLLVFVEDELVLDNLVEVGVTLAGDQWAELLELELKGV